MRIGISIGEVHRFELREALLIYRENQRSFITLHTVELKKQGSPVLGPAQPHLPPALRCPPCDQTIRFRQHRFREYFGRGASTQRLDKTFNECGRQWVKQQS